MSLTSARYQTAGGRYIHERASSLTTSSRCPMTLRRSFGAKTGPSSARSTDDPQFLKAVEVLMEQIGKRAREAG